MRSSWKCLTSTWGPSNGVHIGDVLLWYVMPMRRARFFGGGLVGGGLVGVGLVDGGLVDGGLVGGGLVGGGLGYGALHSLSPSSISGRRS
jgi:hypothetical protein